MKHHTKQTAGLTLIEVLGALAIIAIGAAALLTTSVGSVKNNVSSGSRTQAAQIVSFLARLASTGDQKMFVTQEPSWDYGELSAAFPELTGEGNLADPDRYRAEVTNMGILSIGQAQQIHYRINVCWSTAGKEGCLPADTAGPPPGHDSGPPPPPISGNN